MTVYLSQSEPSAARKKARDFGRVSAITTSRHAVVSKTTLPIDA
jgi:hypothetical protein